MTIATISHVMAVAKSNRKSYSLLLKLSRAIFKKFEQQHLYLLTTRLQVSWQDKGLYDHTHNLITFSDVIKVFIF